MSLSVSSSQTGKPQLRDIIYLSVVIHANVLLLLHILHVVLNYLANFFHLYLTISQCLDGGSLMIHTNPSTAVFHIR